MPNPYEHSIQPILDQLADEGAGVGFVLAPPGQQLLVAQALADRIDGAVALPLSRQAFTLPNRAVILAGLPADKQEMAEALGTINSLRARLREMGLLVILVVSHFEYDEVQRHTGDALSTRLFLETVPLVPQPGDEAEARRSLAAWLRDRFGRLDLRGFIRSEQEDASWAVEEIFQQLRASPMPAWDDQPTPPAGDPQGARGPSRWLLPLALHDESLQPLLARCITDTVPARAAVILGHPGSGKSFFLRWLALHTAHEESWAGIERPFPVLLPLASYARLAPLRSLLDYLSDWLLDQGQPVAHLLPELIASGRAVFLLDGLDEAGGEEDRARLVGAVQKLHSSAPRCPLIVTSRIVGYGDAPLSGAHFTIAPFDDGSIRNFLTRWTELYEAQLKGDSPAARQRGLQQGEQLAREVLTHGQVHELARTPLLLTVLALVHRAGLRLPDHRVELYDHILRILVERWNRIRSLSTSEHPPPLKTADAARLLGPVALAMIEGGARTITRHDLQRHLEASLKAGNLKAPQDAPSLIELFRTSLGLLVEQGPDVFAFLHLTLAEYLACKELVRTSKLESLAADPSQAFDPRWREVLLLAAGELGLLRADDERLQRFIHAICQSAARRPGRPSAGVPMLLSNLLADDPSLSLQSAQELIGELVPKWWFLRRYSRGALFDVLFGAERILPRLISGRFISLISSPEIYIKNRRFKDEDTDEFANGYISIMRILGVNYVPTLGESFDVQLFIDVYFRECEDGRIAYFELNDFEYKELKDVARCGFSATLMGFVLNKNVYECQVERVIKPEQLSGTSASKPGKILVPVPENIHIKNVDKEYVFLVWKPAAS